MVNRHEFLSRLWRDVINGHMHQDGLDNRIRNCARDPQGAFGEEGGCVQRMLDAGVARRDIQLFARSIAFEAVFGVLYALEDLGLDGDPPHGLHEGLLSADPSGLEGRPGSAPE